MKIHWKPIIFLPIISIWGLFLIKLTSNDPGIVFRNSPIVLFISSCALIAVWFYFIYLSIRDTIRYRRDRKRWQAEDAKRERQEREAYMQKTEQNLHLKENE